MGAIPVYRTQNSASDAGTAPVRNAGAAGDGLERIGGALQQVGADVHAGDLLDQQVANRLAAAEKKKTEDDSVVEANSTLSSARNYWLDALKQRQQEALPGAAEFTPTLLNDFDTDAAERLSTAKTKKAKDFLQERLNGLRLDLHEHALSFEIEQGVAYSKTQLANAADQAATAAEFEPGNFERLAGEQRIAALNSGLPEQMANEITRKGRESIAYGAVTGLIRQDPRAALLELETGTTKNRAVLSLDAEARRALLNHAQSQVDRLDAKALVEQNKREAGAERALNEMDRQVSSGIPATPAMWATWRAKTQGTELAGEFSSRVQDERDVQTMLRKPLGDQVAEVQRRQAALEQSGGDARAIANFARLQSAVKQNVAMVQTAPLQWAATRAGEDVPPLDLAKLNDPQGQKDFASSLAQRVNTLGGLQRQFGDAVPMKPLLPQEAQQLSAILQHATPQQAAEVLGTLRNTSGGDSAYRAVLAQAAPDAPVTALAGMIASRQRSQTLATHWFRKDDVAGSRDVATTMLAGQAILNPSKADKGQDGKPVTGLFLPEKTSLQQEFASTVGAAFAGSPGAAEIAFQAVQAYYVGRAAEKGLLASDKTAIDTGLVKESVAATIGQVVDFNGRGEVLAPWGMDESTFSDKVHSAFSALVRDGTITVKRPEELHALSLQNYGADTYRVNNGRSPLLDKSGRPVTLNLGEDAPAPAAAPAAVAKPAGGLLVPGNIDLNARKVLHNPDGSISTELSFSRWLEGKGEVLVPQVVDGKKLTQDEAWNHYLRNGEHLGIFESGKQADTYAERLHRDQARAYSGSGIARGAIQR